MADIGSGLLRPEPLLPDEPDAATWLAQNAALIIASGDKPLSGPQAGLVLGRGDLIHTLHRHPPRVDKLTLAAIEATLSGASTPAMNAIRADPEQPRERATALAADLTAAGVPATVVPSAGLVGGGASRPRWCRASGWSAAAHRV
ncbi:hypothetical protein [Nonomuraea insulae]|uniref:Uncharacterized protein n=1 Tax=Nonomuraea insulae TaxID=1616787 RepID=A0ABW1DAH5_9ACTN